MFGFLRKDKKSGEQLTHYVYLNRAGKFRMMIQELAQLTSIGDKALLVYHFDETRSILEELLKAAGLSYSDRNTPDNNVLLAKANKILEVISDKNNICIQATVAEIHPISGKDELIYNAIHQHIPNARVIFYTSTDSPVMKLFGGDKVQNMMVSLGLHENEKIEHTMVTKSILRAQVKIKAKVQFEKPANSKQEWIELNVRS